MKKRMVSLLLAASMSLSLCACGASDKPAADSQAAGSEAGTKTEAAPAAPADDVFDVILSAAPSGLSPLKTNDAPSTHITNQIYETLYKRTQDGTSYEPLLAEAMPEWDADGKSCTIKLKQGVKFQDGTDFNADAVKYTLECIKDPNYGSARASIAASIDTIEVIDDYTIKLNTLYEDGVLTAKLAHTNAAIVSPTADQKQDLMTEPVGTGAYKLESMVSGSEYVLVSNEDYWGGAPEIKKVKYTVVTEAATAISRLETGEADFMPNATVDQINRLQNIQNVNLVAEPGSQTYFLTLRTDTAKNPAMEDINLRKAIMMAIDREGYVASMNGNATYSNSLLGPKLFGYTEEAENFGYSFNPEEAAKLVQENGYADMELSLFTSSSGVFPTIAQYVQACLQAVGFNKVELNLVEYTSYLQVSKEENYFDIGIFAWSNVTGDGTEFLEPFFESKTGTRVQYHNPEFDQLVKEGKETADPDTRIEKLEAAQKVILDDAAVMPMYHAYLVYASSKAYKDVTEDASGEFDIRNFKLNQ